MRIALIGWSGNANWGDERMYYCIKKFFVRHKIVRFNSFLRAILNIRKVNECDYVLIGGGGLIFRGFNRYSEFLKKITRPFGCIGISIEAEGLNEDMREGLEVLKAKADFIYVRDTKSREILGNHHKVIVGPDITFLYPYPTAPVVKKEICVLNLRNWFWWDVELHSPLHERLDRWDKKYPWIKWFYPFKIWRPERLVALVKRKFDKLIPFPLYFGTFDLTDVVIMKKYFHRIPQRFDLSLLKRSRYLIGMRLHALIFATQLGIPFVSLSYEPKNVNYCDDLNLAALSLPLLHYGKIGKKIEYMTEHYEEIRRTLLNYTKEANTEALYIFSRINKLMQQRVAEVKPALPG